MRKKPRFSDLQLTLIVLGAGFGLLLLSIIAPIAALVTYEYITRPTEAELRASMIDCTLEWGQLEPFPESAEDFTIRTEGSMFTRTFIGSFEDDPEVISGWLESSVGVQQGSKELLPDGSTEYHLKPGGGAIWVKVIVSPDGRVVQFKAVWS